MLDSLCEESGLKMADFWKNSLPLELEHKEVLFKLAAEVSWRGRESKLLKRIRRLAKKEGFSVRDTKLLSKLVNQQRRRGYRNFDELAYYFPGKDAEMLEATYYQYFKK